MTWLEFKLICSISLVLAFVKNVIELRLSNTVLLIIATMVALILKLIWI